MVNQSQSSDVNKVQTAFKKAPRFLGLLRYGIVVGVFVLAVINALVPEPNVFFVKIQMPLIFVGLASLLYHIGQHVHVLHENAIRMSKMMGGSGTGEEKKH